MALVVVAVLGGLRFLQGQASAELTGKSAAGSPDLEDTYADVVTTVATTLAPDGGVPTTLPPVDLNASVAKSASKDRGDWTATVLVQVSPVSGTLPSNVAITGTWTIAPSGTQVPVSCLTQADGTCPLTLTELDKRVNTSVQFTITGVSGPGVGNVTIPGTITIGAP